MGFCGTCWGIWLLSESLCFLTFRDNVIWQNILQKKRRIISFVYFSVTAVTSRHCFSHSYVLFRVWAPLVLTFVQIGVLPLFYATVCFHLEDKGLFVYSVYVVKKDHQDRNVTVREWSEVTTCFVLKCHRWSRTRMSRWFRTMKGSLARPCRRTRCVEIISKAST